MRDPLASASPFGALALLATARAAFGAARRVADRRAGRDASAQEPEPEARRALVELADRLAAHAVRLRVRGAVPAPDVTVTAALALAFEDSVLLSDLAETSALAHQKLLSVYPAVDPELPEAARRLARDAAERAGSDEARHAPIRLAESTVALVGALREALV